MKWSEKETVRQRSRSEVGFSVWSLNKQYTMCSQTIFSAWLQILSERVCSGFGELGVEARGVASLVLFTIPSGSQQAQIHSLKHQASTDGHKHFTVKSLHFILL